MQNSQQCLSKIVALYYASQKQEKISFHRLLVSAGSLEKFFELKFHHKIKNDQTELVQSVTFFINKVFKKRFVIT